MTDEQREAVVREALSWLGTPYHHMGMIKGAGCDCGMFPLMVYSSVGIINEQEVGFYPEQWHLHRTQEIYLERVAASGAVEITEPKKGDFVVFKHGKTYSHGAIIIEWPMQIIHSVIRLGVVLSDAGNHPALKDAPRKFFTKE